MDYDLVIFDVDWTLVRPASGGTLRATAADWEWLPGRLAELRRLHRTGVRIAFATNQGGVAFGRLKEDEIVRELETMVTAIVRGVSGADIVIEMACNHPQATVDRYRRHDRRRKPGPGMLQSAMDRTGVAASRTVMVGDMDVDREAARAAGVAFEPADAFFRALARPGRSVSDSLEEGLAG